jgi:hypothetical protein
MSTDEIGKSLATFRYRPVADAGASPVGVRSRVDSRRSPRQRVELSTQSPELLPWRAKTSFSDMPGWNCIGFCGIAVASLRVQMPVSVRRGVAQFLSQSAQKPPDRGTTLITGFMLNLNDGQRAARRAIRLSSVWRNGGTAIALLRSARRGLPARAAAPVLMIYSELNLT